MTQQINGTVREKLINCDTHFDNDQIEAIMKVVEDSGYSDMYEALKDMVSWYIKQGFNRELPEFRAMQQALAKAEGK